MKIRDLISGRSVDELEAKVIDKKEPRTVMTKFGRTLTVTNITLEDETGKIEMVLWGEDGDKVEVGDELRIKDAYVKEFRGERQITLGRNGKLEVKNKM